MANIIIASEKIKLFNLIESWSLYAGYSPEWANEFWQDLLTHKEIYDEFLYYVDHEDFLCKYSIGDQFITDIFIWEMRKFNIKTDRGKNYADCDKAEMILNAFRTMLDMDQNAKAAERVKNAMETKNGADQT